MKELKRRLLNILISLDQTLIVLLTLGHANPDWTISASAWRWEREGRPLLRYWRPVIDAAFWFDRDHCYESWRSEVERRQLPRRAALWRKLQ